MAEENEKPVTEYEDSDLKKLRVRKNRGDSLRNGPVVRFAGYAEGVDRAPGAMVVLYDENPGDVREITTWITIARDDFERNFVVRDADQSRY